MTISNYNIQFPHSIQMRISYTHTYPHKDTQYQYTCTFVDVPHKMYSPAYSALWFNLGIWSKTNTMILIMSTSWYYLPKLYCKQWYIIWMQYEVRPTINLIFIAGRTSGVLYNTSPVCKGTYLKNGKRQSKTDTNLGSHATLEVR